MSTMNSKSRRIPDFEAQAIFRTPEEAAITAATNMTSKPLNRLTQAYWDNGEIPHGVIIVAGNVHAHDRTTGDETVQFVVQVSDVADFSGTVTDVAQTPVLGANALGYFELRVDSDNLQDQLGANAAHIRLRAVVAGTSPSTSFAAWMTHEDASK
jgi:hypothetical protein